MKKKILSVLLTLCMLLTLLPVVALPALAAGTITELYVGGTSVIDGTNITYWKSDGQGGITATTEGAGDYTVKYDPTGTEPALTLKGATITKTHINYGDKCGIYVAGSGWPHLDLALIGNNTITGADCEGGSYGICSGQTSIDITSEASATLSVSGKSGNSSCGISIASTVLEISGQAAVIATGGIASYSGSIGVSCSGLTLSGSASLTATGSQAGEYSCGVYLMQALTVSAGTTLSATGGASGDGCYSYGILSTSATISGTVTATGGDASGSLTVESQGTTYGSSYGLHGSTTLNSGGSLTATSGTCHESGKSMAVYSDGFTNSSDYPVQGAETKDGALGTAVYNPTLKTIVTGTDTAGETIARRVSIAPPPVELTFTDSDDYDVPAGTVGTAIAQIDVASAATGGTPPYTFSKESGPNWLDVASDGKITGTPHMATPAATTATIKVTDSAGTPAVKTITIDVGAVYGSWVDDVKFNYSDDSTVSGTGWTWDGGSKTLTLSGVDITADRTAICINGSAKIVLEGANRVESSAKAISSGGTLTIEGSGTLEADGETTGIYVVNELTINSGHITASGDTGIHTYDGIIMNGGHVEATATGHLDRGVYIHSQSFTMNGGYLKASGENGLYASAAVTVSGGYLEAEGTAGYGIGTFEERLFTNSGGVVKTTGTTYGIDANCSFTGGVTIANGTTKAIDGTVTGSEKYWALAEGVPSGGTDLPATATAIDGTSLVIAKSITTPALANGTYTLDGHYLYKADESAFYLTSSSGTATATVTGGSYLKSGNDTACYVGGTITVGDATANHPTLVCEAPANTKYALNAKAVDVKANGTLYGCAPQNGYGIYTVNNTAGISSAGQLIGVGTTYGIHTTTGDAGVATTSYGTLSVTGGYVCGVGIGNTAPTGIKSGVSATGGYISVVSTGTINSYALDAQHGSVSVTDAAALTAANTGSGKAYAGADITGAVTGAASKYGALGTANIATDKVLLIKSLGTAPTITTTALGGGTVGSPYRTILQATGTAPITWSVTTGELPAGLALETATGIISGTPTAAETKDFTVTATNAAGSDAKELTLTVSARPSPGYTPPAQTVPVVGDGAVNIPVTISGGTAKLAPTGAQLDSLLAGDPENVDVDLSGTGGVTSAQLPSSLLDALAENGQAGLTVQLPAGRVSLDAEAVTDLAALTDGAPATFTFASGAKAADSYDGRLLKRTADASFDVGIAVGGKPVSGLEAGFELDLEEYPELERPGVYTLDEDGELEYVMSRMDGDIISFYPPHFSPFYVVDFPFTDVPGEAWFNEDAAFAYLEGLFEGTSDTAFSPHATMTRAMLVTVLWRLEGEPAPKGANAFDDVAEGQYYTEAVVWASENGVVDGYGDGKFGPDDMITREQMATALYRYEQYKGGGFTGAWMFQLDFPDSGKVSDWAYEALCWCTMNGVIEGSDGLLMPDGNAERCQVAAVLHRFCASVER